MSTDRMTKSREVLRPAALPGKREEAPAAPRIPTPRELLAGLLGQPLLLERAAAAAPLLLPDAEPGVRFVRCVYVLLGVAAPAEDAAAAFMARLRAQGWQVGLPGLDPPQWGDLGVWADEQRQPLRVGFISPLSLDGQWLTAIQPDGSRERIRPLDLSCFLQMPCPACDQARTMAAMAARRGRA